MPVRRPLDPPPDGSALSPSVLVRLRDRLVRAGLDAAAWSASRTIGGGGLDPLRVPVARAVLRTRATRGSRLLGLFAYDDPMPRSVVVGDLGSNAVDDLLACCLLVDEDGILRAPARVFAVGDVLTAGDWLDRGEDAVMAMGPTTTQLLRAIPPLAGGRVLDVGTGSGSVALLLAARGCDVVATDVNERAVAFARFNAALNGLGAAVDVRCGDLLAPVAGERFDVVVSQPPFVIEPEGVAERSFMHGGTTGEELTLALLGGLGAVLADDGRAVVRADAVADGAYVERARDAVGGHHDVVVFEYPGMSVDDTALGYGHLADPTFGDEFGAVAARYRAHGEAVTGKAFRGTVTFVRRGSGVGTSLRVARSPTWAEMEARLASLDVTALDDAELARAHLRPVDAARLAVEQDLDEADREPAYLVRLPPTALSDDVEVNEVGAALMQLFAGGVGVAAVVAAYAEAAGVTPSAAAVDVFAFVRDALVRGLLTPCASDGR